MRLWVGLLLFAGLASAQWGGGGGDDRIQASIRGGGGDGGKCTAEVDVDGVAEVSINGDTGYIRTLQGARATWKRLECNNTLPRDPQDFRFKGVDGRGRQSLARDPRSNRGVAVIRIEDTGGGREGYTFDIEWRGGSSGGNWGGSGGSGGGWGGSGGSGGGWGGSGGSGGGWGGSGGSGGWGSGGGSGWGNSWGNDINYRGGGSGEFSRQGGQRMQISGVYVQVRRSGDVVVRMDTNYGREALRFNGQIQRVSGNIIYADVRDASNQGERADASGTIELNIRSSNRVDAIRVNGNVRGSRFNVNWRE